MISHSAFRLSGHFTPLKVSGIYIISFVIAGNDSFLLNSDLWYLIFFNNALYSFAIAFSLSFLSKFGYFASNSSLYALNSSVVGFFTFTTTYHKRQFSKKPRIEIYVDGPFYPDLNLPIKEAQQELRDTCYNTMCERAKLNTYEFVTYKKSLHF